MTFSQNVNTRNVYATIQFLKYWDFFELFIDI